LETAIEKTFGETGDKVKLSGPRKQCVFIDWDGSKQYQNRA